ncbi:cation diffusion facilitator family transporter [Lachnoclostridium sp. An138]|uniref:cation diffusion facilitator family transporter n=1 Tax=Lachnoclostridium sp. An138 TaxID=1965560 RepID=UPI000B36C13C|nr:cation diffusion facilitator family transporter [Lachnoclostridium sp. An138]OUQ19928.1 cation-efflux pump [Lachnoclostridium sp. An138]
MTELLVRKFVKNYQNTDDSRVRTDYGVLTSVVGILCNVLLFAGKLAVGMVMRSVSVMADAFNNLSDAASSVIGFVGVKMAGKPADREHPFGHGRIEYIAALVVAFLVIQVGLTFFKSSLDKIRHPEDLSFDLVSMLILTASVAVKLWLGRFNKALGKRINSSVMQAAAADALGDVVTTLATMGSILFFHFTQINIDGFVGLLVSLVVMWAGIGIARDTLEPLIGQPVDPKLYREISEFVESYDGILGSHDLIVHNYGPTRSLASIHAEVPNDVDIETSHEIIDRIERDAARKLGIFLVIHMDPVAVRDERVTELKEQVTAELKKIDERLSLHDFRIVDGEQQINLIFDVVVPHSYSDKDMTQLHLDIVEKVSGLDPRYQCVVTLENGYIAEDS